MKSENTVILLGAIGQDPELRMTQGGKAVCNISLATTESYKDKNDHWQESTQWHKLVLWGPLAEMVGKKLSKGDKLYIKGKLKYGSYENKDGVKIPTADIQVTDAIPLGRNPARDSHENDPF